MRRKKKPKPIVTDTAGEPVRVARATIRRVLTAPVAVTAGGPATYALAHCEAADCWIARIGRTSRTAYFELVIGDVLIESTQIAGLNRLIDRMIAAIKEVTR